MPRYRKLPTCTLDSPDVAAMPDDFTRLTWLFLPLICTRDGTTYDNATFLRSKLYPLREDVTVEQVQAAIEWYKARGMIGSYEANGRSYLFLVNWVKYQGKTEREAESNLPPPPTQELSQTCSGVNQELVESGSAEMRMHMHMNTASESALSASNSRAQEQARPLDKQPIPPPLTIYQELTGIIPNPDSEQRQAILSTVGITEDCLQRWRYAIRAWLLNDYKRTNVGGMLRWYAEGVPEAKRPPEQAGGPAPPGPVVLTAEECEAAKRFDRELEAWNARAAAEDRRRQNESHTVSGATGGDSKTATKSGP